jgi:hypothetical protein
MKNSQTIILISVKDIGIDFVERADGIFTNNNFVTMCIRKVQSFTDIKTYRIYYK